MSDKEDKKYYNKIVLPYSILPSTLEPTLWPLVIVNISDFKDPLNQKIYALIDSGASCSVLDKEIAVRMGVNLKKCKKYTGGRSVSDSYNFWILNDPIYIEIEGIEFPVVFNIIDSNKTMWSMILGEDSIFKHSQITFRKFKNEYDIKFLKDLN